MKSRVNLYLPQYQPKLELLTLGALVTVLVILLMIVIATRFGLSLQGSAAEQRLVNLESEVQQQSDFVKTLTNQLQQRKEDPKLLAIFAGLQTTLKDKERLKVALQDMDALKSTTFSLMLRELSQQHQESLWLTRINVTEHSMEFVGEVTKPEALPQWVGRLGKTDYFTDRTFDEASLMRDDRSLRFSLKASRDTTIDTKPKGAQ